MISHARKRQKACCGKTNTRYNVPPQPNIYIRHDEPKHEHQKKQKHYASRATFFEQDKSIPYAKHERLPTPYIPIYYHVLATYWWYLRPDQTSPVPSIVQTAPGSVSVLAETCARVRMQCATKTVCLLKKITKLLHQKRSFALSYNWRI